MLKLDYLMQIVNLITYTSRSEKFNQKDASGLLLIVCMLPYPNLKYTTFKVDITFNIVRNLNDKCTFKLNKILKSIVSIK